MKRAMTDTSLEAFYSTPALTLQEREKQIMAVFKSTDDAYTRQQLERIAGMRINAICGRVRSLLDKGALVVRGELKCKTTGKYRELLGLPEKHQRTNTKTKSWKARFWKWKSDLLASISLGQWRLETSQKRTSGSRSNAD